MEAKARRPSQSSVSLEGRQKCDRSARIPLLFYSFILERCPRGGCFAPRQKVSANLYFYTISSPWSQNQFTGAVVARVSRTTPYGRLPRELRTASNQQWEGIVCDINFLTGMNSTPHPRQRG